MNSFVFVLVWVFFFHLFLTQNSSSQHYGDEPNQTTEGLEKHCSKYKGTLRLCIWHFLFTMCERTES